MSGSPARSAGGERSSNRLTVCALGEPLVGGGETLAERHLGRPTKYRLRLFDVYEGLLLFSRAVWREFDWHIAARDLLQLIRDVDHAGANAGSNVECASVESTLVGQW